MNLASFFKISTFWDARGQKVRENSDKIAKIQRDYWAYGMWGIKGNINLNLNVVVSFRNFNILKYKFVTQHPLEWNKKLLISGRGQTKEYFNTN